MPTSEHEVGANGRVAEPVKPGAGGEGPYSFNEIYAEELTALGRQPTAKPVGLPTPDLAAAAEAAKRVPREILERQAERDRRARSLLEAHAAVAEHEARRDGNLQALYRHAATSRNEAGDPLSAICLSGGGIRSATFNLGVLQALARRGVLGRFDYLSSVSGGGYISGWLQAWRKHDGKETAFGDLAGSAPSRPHAPEAKPLDHLREYANYLTPRTGLFSIDTWSAVAIFTRNVVLNWLLLIPLLAAIVAMPMLCYLALQSPPTPDLTPSAWVAIALALGLLGETATFYFRCRRGTGEDAPGLVVAAALIPTWLSATTVVVLADRIEDGASTVVGHAGVFPFALAWMIGMPLVGWALAWVLNGARRVQVRAAEIAGFVVGGTVGAALVVLAGDNLFPFLYVRPALLVMLGLPLLLGIKLAARSLLVAWFGLGEMRKWKVADVADYDREWWARHSGWTLLALATWIVLSGLALVATPVVRRYLPLILPAGGISGLVTWLAGMSGATSAGRRGEKSRSPMQEVALKAAVPVFCAALLGLVGLGMAALGGYVAGLGWLLPLRSVATRVGADPTDPQRWVYWAQIARVAAVAAGLLGLSAFMGMVVNVNRFSLHGLYRNRLVRAYLGASRRTRRPDRFTGFDPGDNVPLHKLWEWGSDAALQRPLPVYNAALNLLGGADHLAWQQRKAESLSMSPLFVGNFHDGYRRSEAYGGSPGLTLGTAMAISGAAANPNMGYHSSPTVSFLLTLFNARLGAWLGNPGYAGANTFPAPGPRWALRPLVAELVGKTDASNCYVNLSDGGHFDNLGLYEMVLRRCRFIFSSDAGQDAKDGTFSFEDLGNAVRKVRIDFGIPIEFVDRIRILPRDEGGTGLYCARGIVKYSAVDGTDPQHDGVLFYIKPAVYARGEPVPYDVVSYARHSELFPHEPTADQWFDESQFESYRVLGLHAVEQMSAGMAGDTLEVLQAAIAAYMAAAPEATPAPPEAVRVEPEAAPVAAAKPRRRATDRESITAVRLAGGEAEQAIRPNRGKAGKRQTD